MVATDAVVRRAVVEQILAQLEVPHLILEKVLFQQLDDYHAVGELLERRGARAWVNCPRRLWPDYGELRTRTLGRPLRIGVSGGDWAMASNAVHFVDLAAYLSGQDDFEPFFQQLDGGARPSRRAGFFEISGSARFLAGEVELSLTSWAAGGAPLLVTVGSDSLRWLVREGEQRVW